MTLIDIARNFVNASRQRRVNRLGGKPTWCRVPQGFMMKIDPTQGMDIGYYLGTYEPGLIKLISLLVREGDTSVDIGTHKGYITLTLAQRTGNAGKVVSIDPDPRVFQEMSDNCDRNGYSQVVRFPCVASNADGTCEFSLSSQLGNSSRFPNEIARPTVSSIISVPARRADDLLSEAGMSDDRPLSFVKIDAEGSEPLVLHGLEKTIAIHKPALCMEINTGSLVAGGFSADDITKHLSPFGYRYYRLQWKRNSLYLARLTLHPLAEADIRDAVCDEILAITDGHRDRGKLDSYICSSRS